MGRKPQPLGLKLLNGTYRKDRDRPGVQVAPLTEMPEAPESLGDVGAAVWECDGPKLIALGVLSALDLRAFELYCQAFDELAACNTTLADDGEYITTESGYVAPHPAISRRKSVLDRIQKAHREFGMTPSSRRGVDASPHSPSGVLNWKSRGAEDDLDAFLSNSEPA